MNGQHPLAGQPTTRCRWCSHHTEMVWCRTSNDKQIPIEATPDPAGNVEIVPNRNGGPPFAIVHAGPPGMFDEWVAHMPHHATCPRDLQPKGTP